MAAGGRTPFVFGDIGMFLVEKAMRNERCQFCGMAISVGDVVKRLGCNHVVHSNCFDMLGGYFSCLERHTLDSRYSIRVLVQDNSDLNKRVGNAQAFVEQIKRTCNFDPPIISDSDRSRLLGASSSSALPPPTEDQLQDRICFNCFEFIPLGRATFFHEDCFSCFCFRCINQNRTVCPKCQRAAGDGAEMQRLRD